MMDKIEEIVREIKAGKKYKTLCIDTIRDVVSLEVAKHNSLKNAVKSAKKKLHLILAPYLSELNHSTAAQELRSAFSSGEQGRVGDACLNLMGRHASTRERISILDEFYAEIFKITGKPGKLADLACALNPLSYRWMSFSGKIEYHAFDNNINNVELINLYFGLEGLNPLAELRDILCKPSGGFFDVGFLFKMYHCLEHRQKGAGWQVVEKAPVRWLAVSFPTRNLANRKVNIFSNYSKGLLDNIERNNWDSGLLEFDKEIVLLIKKSNITS